MSDTLKRYELHPCVEVERPNGSYARVSDVVSMVRAVWEEWPLPTHDEEGGAFDAETKSAREIGVELACAEILRRLGEEP